MPLNDQLKINLDKDVSKYLDFLKMELKKTFKDIVEELIITRYKKYIDDIKKKKYIKEKL